MRTEKIEERLEVIQLQKAQWTEIIQQWAALTPFAKIPMYTKEHAVKMLKKLKKEERSLGVK